MSTRTGTSLRRRRTGMNDAPRHGTFSLTCVPSLGRSGTEAMGESGGMAGSSVSGSMGHRPSSVHSVEMDEHHTIVSDDDAVTTYRTCRS